MTTILLLAALLFGGLSVSGVKGPNWAGLGVLCLAIAALVSRGALV